MGLVHSHAQFWRTKALLPIARKVSAIQESRNASSSKRRKRSFRHRRQYTKADLQRLEDTTERSPVFPKWSKAFVWGDCGCPSSQVRQVLLCDG
jgi:hypothetical protein